MNDWIPRLLLNLIGIVLVIRGVTLKEKEKVDSNLESGCLIDSLALLFIFAGILRLMPLGFQKTIWLFLGICFILIGILPWPIGG